MNFPLSSTTSKNPSHLAFSWILVLRWGALAGQVATIVLVYLFFKIELPVKILLFIFIFGVASNFFFSFLLKKEKYISQWLFAVVMFLDVTLLTCLLHYTGGPMNPFTFLFVVHIVLGAVLMNSRMSWALTLFTIVCYAVIFFLPSSESCGHLTFDILKFRLATESSSDTSGSFLSMHLQGMWFAFVVTAIFIVYFVGKIQRDLEEQQGIAAKLKEEKLKSEKLASLATLAAGAAHELSTPLSTIAVVAGEMTHAFKKDPEDNELYEDARLIRNQVEQCKDILYQMAADAGEHLGEALEKIFLNSLLEDVVETYGNVCHGPLTVQNDAGDILLFIPIRMFTRTLKGILKNACEASEAGKPMDFHIKRSEERLFFIIKDRGCGMSEEKVEKAVEPFFTTKESMSGLGLGLFLAKSMCERFGGSLEIHSELGTGTTVTLSVALEKVSPVQSELN